MRTLVALFALTLASPALADLAGEVVIGDPIQVANITVFPLTAKSPAPDPGYLTLDAALEGKQLTIRETDTSGRVNTLHVTNTSGRAIYALAGEVVLGGKQDRIIGNHTLIPKAAKDFAVSVYCVEHGRWRTGGSLEFASANTLAHTKLRQRANADGQSAVWSEVAEKNKVRGTVNATDTYRAAISKKDHNQKLDAMNTALGQALAGRTGLAGVLVAIDGKLRAIDWFAAPGLYARLAPKLLRSYAAEAVDGGGRATGPAPGLAQARAFLTKADGAALRDQKRAGAGDLYRFDSVEIEGALIVDRDAPAKRAVHRTYFSK